MNDKGLLDFTDLLEMFADADDTYYPKLEVAIIDEAQDLSPLQWKIADRLIKRATKSYIAGDDDQAIFGWAGADVRSLLTYPGDQIVLNQSYRIPRVVHEYGNKIINRVKYRVPKVWDSRPEEGELHFYQHLYKSLDPEVVKEMAGMDNMADLVTYSRAWFYISKLDLKRRVDVDALIAFTSEDLLYTTEMALRYFEGIEEYEKCAHIKKIQDTVKKILNKA